MAHTCTRAHDKSDDRQRKKFGGGSPPARECSAGTHILTLWERVSLGTCLIGGGKLTHSLCKQAHMAIITLIFGGGAGEMQEDRAGGTRQKRKVGMERAKKGAPWFSCLRMYVLNLHRVLPSSLESLLKHPPVMPLLLRAALSREAVRPLTH